MARHTRRVSAEATRALTRYGIGQGTEQGAGPSGVSVSDQGLANADFPIFACAATWPSHGNGGHCLRNAGWITVR
jgi:hypothetical protein